MAASGRFRVGTSGWIYRHWRGRFYPPELPARHWFEHYQKVFDTVEINNTFVEAHAVRNALALRELLERRS